MTDRQLSYRDLLDIVELVKASSHFSEFHLKMGDIELTLSRNVPGRPGAGSAPAKQAGSQNLLQRIPGPENEPAAQRHGHIGGGELIVNNAPLPQQMAPRPLPASYPAGSALVKSPMVGTFYCAPEPHAQPFVQVGQKVDADTVVCIIEVMKLMNSIPAGHAGIITHVLVEDARPVEYGQVLMVIEPTREA